MKLVTLLAAIAAVAGALLPILSLMSYAGIFEWSIKVSCMINILSLFTSVAYALFFITLYNKQK